MNAPLRSKKLGLACYALGVFLLVMPPVIMVRRQSSAEKQLREMAEGMARQAGVPSYEVTTSREYRESEDEIKKAVKTGGENLFFLMIPLAGACFFFGRRLRAESAEELMARDKRPPVVYFRSFKDDARRSIPAMAEVLSLRKFGRTEEEESVKELKAVGPVVAIGDPKEMIPLAGAARFYSNHDDWQALAHELIGKAALVVYRAGLTPGFIWEIERGRQHLAPEQMVILFPEPKMYEEFRKLAGDVFQLPEKLAGPVLWFQSDWSAQSKGKWGKPLKKAVQEFVAGRRQ